MRILFATVAALKTGPSGPASDWASARYRVLLPARELERLGNEVTVESLDHHGGRWPGEVKRSSVDVAIVSKSFHEENEALATTLKSRGVRVLADVCDDHFDDAEHGGHLRRMVAMADGIVAASDAMADSIRFHAKRDSIVVTDPVEGPRHPPRFAPQAPRLRIAWFGMPGNLRGLSARGPELQTLFERMPVHLTIVTKPMPEVMPFIERLAAVAPSRLRVELVPWSLDATWSALAQADMVWIPSDDSPQSAVKSPNRLLEALWAGRFVVAGDVPSYRPFADLVPVGKDLTSATMEALSNPQSVEERIARAQERIAALHSPAAVGAQWARAIGA